MGSIYSVLYTQEEVCPSSALCGLCQNLRVPLLPDICLVKIIIQVKISKPNNTMSLLMCFSDPKKNTIFLQIYICFFFTSLQTHLTSFTVSSHLRTSPFHLI